MDDLPDLPGLAGSGCIVVWRHVAEKGSPLLIAGCGMENCWPWLGGGLSWFVLLRGGGVVNN